MSTSAMIGSRQDDGTILAIAVHWSGYPRWTGQILADHYTDPAKITALLALGALSELGKEIGDKHPFSYKTDAYNPATGKYDRITYPAEWDDWCLAYHRDRGEAMTPAASVTLAMWPKTADEFDAEYVYLWETGAWHVAQVRGRWPAPHFGTWTPVRAVLEDMAA